MAGKRLVLSGRIEASRELEQQPHGRLAATGKRMTSVDEHFVEGHCEVIPGFHATRAVPCGVYFRSAGHVQEDCRLLAGQMIEVAADITAVACGSPCGHLMSAFVATALAERLKHDIKILAVTFQDGTASLVPGFSLSAEDRVAVIYENALRGDRIGPIMALVKGHGAAVPVVGVLVDRRKKPIEIVPYVSLTKDPGNSFDVAKDEVCPACSAGRSMIVTKVA